MRSGWPAARRGRGDGAYSYSESTSIGLFYTTRDAQQLRQINADTAKLQADLSAALQGPAANPTPVIALALGA
jgi:hypothetical protein